MIKPKKHEKSQAAELSTLLPFSLPDLPHKLNSNILLAPRSADKRLRAGC